MLSCNVVVLLLLLLQRVVKESRGVAVEPGAEHPLAGGHRGIDVEPVLGSRATDIMSGLGPPLLSAGDVLPVGTTQRPVPGVDVAPVPEPISRILECAGRNDNVSARQRLKNLFSNGASARS